MKWPIVTDIFYYNPSDCKYNINTMVLLISNSRTLYYNQSICFVAMIAVSGNCSLGSQDQTSSNLLYNRRRKSNDAVLFWCIFTSIMPLTIMGGRKTSSQSGYLHSSLRVHLCRYRYSSSVLL